MGNTRKSVITALLVSLGLVLHFIENMIPLSFIIPGARLGLANAANLIGLVLLGFKGGFLILILRIVLGSLLTGTFMSINFYLSISGGLPGFFVMAFAFYLAGKRFSLLGISVIGACFHNLGQITASYFIIHNPGIFYYLPYLILLSIPTGIAVGLISFYSLKHIPDRAVRGE